MAGRPQQDERRGRATQGAAGVEEEPQPRRSDESDIGDVEDDRMTARERVRNGDGLPGADQDRLIEISGEAYDDIATAALVKRDASVARHVPSSLDSLSLPTLGGSREFPWCHAATFQRTADALLTPGRRVVAAA